MKRIRRHLLKCQPQMGWLLSLSPSRRNCWGELKQQKSALGEFSLEIWDKLTIGFSWVWRFTNSWFHMNLSDREAPSWMPIPVIENENESVLALALCREVTNLILDIKSDFPIEGSWFQRKCRNVAWTRLSMYGNQGWCILQCEHCIWKGTQLH